MLQTLRCFLRDALLGLWRARMTNLLTIAIIMASLAILGGFLLLRENLGSLAGEWDRVQLHVYLRDDGAQERTGEVAALIARLRAHSLVRDVRHVSRDEALELFRSRFAALAPAANQLSENPFPASLEIGMIAGAGEALVSDREALLDELRQSPLVEMVQDSEEDARRLRRALGIVTAVGAGVGMVLALASVFIIFNVIRLTVNARREEIAVMRLVGATAGFIRGPFLVEGMLQGGLGAIGAIAILYAAHLVVLDWAARSGSELAGILSARFLPLAQAAALAAGGLLIGLLGSALSLRRHLA